MRNPFVPSNAAARIIPIAVEFNLNPLLSLLLKYHTKNTVLIKSLSKLAIIHSLKYSQNGNRTHRKSIISLFSIILSVHGVKNVVFMEKSTLFLVARGGWFVFPTFLKRMNSHGEIS